ncbi:MAG TPA: hypothetical protein VHU91_10015 [Mycobacteriales bacterium]|jgi:hypothetical protein|nr:hypothetical protein [Mycobacteriales bacterium]
MPVQPDPDPRDESHSGEVIDPFDMPDEADESFVPPEPPPLPIFSPATVLAALAVLTGLTLVIFPGFLSSFLGVSTELALVLSAGLLFTGVSVLIARLRNPDPEDLIDSGSDPGAQV